MTTNYEEIDITSHSRDTIDGGVVESRFRIVQFADPDTEQSPPPGGWDSVSEVLLEAEKAEAYSLDPRRKVGAAYLCKEDSIVASACNKMPPPYEGDLDAYADRELKNKHIIHAEIGVMSKIRPTRDDRRGLTYCHKQPQFATTYPPCRACVEKVLESHSFYMFLFPDLEYDDLTRIRAYLYRSLSERACKIVFRKRFKKWYYEWFNETEPFIKKQTGTYFIAYR